MLLGKKITQSIREATVHHSGSGKLAIRQGEWVLIDAPTGDDNGKSGEPQWLKQERGYAAHGQPGELFDLRQDVSERKNLYAEQPEKSPPIKSAVGKIQKRRTQPTMSTRYLPLAAVVFVCWFVPAATHAADKASPAKKNPDCAEMQRQMKKGAQQYSHFATADIISNRLTTNRWPKELEGEQARLLADLQKWAKQPECLHVLIGHGDAKVRTLALGSLFVRMDPHELPFIASLLDDQAPTLSHIDDSGGSGGGIRRLAEIVSPQTVGEVVRAMLKYWGVGKYPVDGVTPDDFQTYWNKYAGREYSASWFVIKMTHATRSTTPIQKEYQRDIQRVLLEIDALPPVERAWTRLFVLAPSGRNHAYQASDGLVPDTELLATARELGPEALLHFLQRKPVTDDPDLRNEDRHNPNFWRIAIFLLRNADHLLRAEDADALLAFEKNERDSLLVSGTAWSIGAALLQPARAGEILRTAIQREPKKAGDSWLTGAMWRISGPAEIKFLTEWFYAALLKDKQGTFEHRPESFLMEVESAARPDTKELLVALMKHPGFDLTDWTVLKEMLKIANTGRITPLVSVRDIYDAQPRDTSYQRTVVVKWRNLLRREYGLPERPLPSPVPEPKQILTQPAYSVPLTDAPVQLLLSPDGQALATLIEGTVEIRDAKSGASLWKVPGRPYPWRRCMAFNAAGQRLVLFDIDGLVSEWDVPTRKLVRQVELTGKPQNGVGQGFYTMDRAALRAGFAGYNPLVCFDTRDGKALWLHESGGGVGSVVALSPDGSLLAAGPDHESFRTIKLFEAATGRLVRQFDQHGGRVGALAFSSDGRALATISSEDGTRLWDVTTGEMLREFSYPVIPFDRSDGKGIPAFSPDGRWLAIVKGVDQSGGTRIGIFSVDTGELHYEVRPSREYQIHPWVVMAFAPDGGFLYTGGGRRLDAWSLK